MVETDQATSPAAAQQRSDDWLRASGSSRVNVGKVERWISVLGGGMLTAYGLSRFSGKRMMLAATGGVLLYRGLTGHCPALGALGISTAREQPQPAHVVTALTVYKPREEVYAFWRELENLPRFMRHLESVRQLDGEYSQWSARIPGDLGSLSWQAEVIEERPGEKLAWRSVPGSEIDNAGSVLFREAPHGGTELHVTISYRPPAGAVGVAAAHLLTPVLEQMVKEDVRRFKHLMETGEIPTTEGQPAGKKD